MMVSLDTQHSIFSCSFSFSVVMSYDLHISTRDMFLLFLFYYVWFVYFRGLLLSDGGNWGWDGYRRDMLG